MENYFVKICKDGLALTVASAKTTTEAVPSTNGKGANMQTKTRLVNGHQIRYWVRQEASASYYYANERDMIDRINTICTIVHGDDCTSIQIHNREAFAAYLRDTGSTLERMIDRRVPIPPVSGMTLAGERN